MLRKLGKFTVLLLAVSSCAHPSPPQGETKDLQVSISADLLSPDVRIIEIPDITVDAYIDPCADVQNIDVDYCTCFPRCCQQQTWYCPPTGTEIQAKEAILDICGEDYVPCDRNLDDACPPAEIIFESDCAHAFDCPPGINEDFTMYYDCESNGNPGRQEVRCDKGRLYYGECVTCIVSDEICDGQDNDCDNEIDENQLNECGLCGPLPQDTCDGLDNDCDGDIDEELIQECVTTCERGIEVCVDGRWIGCTARQPSVEACDGQDNDCDALVDEGLQCECPPEIIGALLPCMEPPLSCGMGFKSCECDNDDCSVTKYSDCLALCAWLPPELVPADDPEACNALLGIPVNPEVCNNFDEDCDDLVDEELVKSCYSGPEGTGGIGVCSLGEMLCLEGQWFGELSNGDLLIDFCAGEVVPSREICDGADNDCDGTTDFGEAIPDTDILFILDWSGSMEYSINATQTAMNRFASQFSAEQKLKWGLITGPRIFPVEGLHAHQQTEWLRRETDIASFADFMSAFSSAGAFGPGTTSEMLRDALYMSVSTISTNLPYDLAAASWLDRFHQIDSIPTLHDFRINWRPDADRIIIVFTDEEDQSFLDPTLDPQPLIDALSASPNTKLYVFTRSYYQARWSRYTQPTAGGMFALTTNADQTYNDLMSILDEICLSGDQASQRVPLRYSRYQRVSLGSRYDFEIGLCY